METRPLQQACPCPDGKILCTTALATINRDSGRELGLMGGANVVMPNLTPPGYRVKYEIYPGKACISETAQACQMRLRYRIEALGRQVGSGPGGRVGRAPI
jgi:biotin synthase